MSKSPYIRYDKSQGLWIQHRKVVYLYWYKFLQHAERDDRYDVDWSKYESWGGRETVIKTKFDIWWKEYWRDLFGFHEGQPETAKFHTQATPRADDLRTTLLIYENLYRGDYWTVGCYVRHIEEKKGRKVAKSLVGADRDLWTSPTDEQKKTEGISRWRNNPRIRKKSEGDAVFERKEGWVTMNHHDGNTHNDYFNWELRQGVLSDNRLVKRRVQGYVSGFVKRCDELMKRVANGSL
jgi:hypothetical protein